MPSLRRRRANTVSSGKNLYEPSEVAQELTKEVMDSSFISAKTKEEYCDKLGSLSTGAVPPAEVVDLKDARAERSAERRPGLEEYRARMVTMMSAMMGILTASMTMVLAVSKEGPFGGLFAASKEKLTLLWPMLLSVLAAALTLFVMFAYREVLMRTQERKRESETRKTRRDPKDDEPA